MQEALPITNHLELYSYGLAVFGLSRKTGVQLVLHIRCDDTHMERQWQKLIGLRAGSRFFLCIEP